MLEVFQNFDLLSVGLAVAATTVLGFTVYFNNPQSITNKTFFVFSLMTAVWGILNFLSYRINNIKLAFWFLRIELLLGVWLAFLLFTLFHIFLLENFSFSKAYKILLSPLVFITSLLCLTPFVFVKVSGLTTDGFIDTIEIGSGIVLFGVVSIGLVVVGFISLFKRMSLSTSEKDKRFFRLIFLGSFFMFLPLIILNFIFPAFLNNSRFVPFGAVTIFPFIIFTSYAILKHKLFNIKVAGTGVLVFLLSVVTFSEVILAQDFSMIVYRSSVLLLVLSFGILLIKSVLREVRQREEIQELAARLKSVNSILAHDVKATIAKGRDAFSLLLDGTYGLIPEKAKPLLAGVMRDMNKMLNAIINILAAGHDMTLTLKPFDLKEAVLEAARDAAKDAEEKHLTIKTDIPAGDYTITADKTQLVAHVLKNLIENAINYNLENGFITVSLARPDQKKFLLTIKDTGIGIKDDDKPNMFKEGGRGQESSKINVHSSGYGLATAKKTVEAHGGRIWFESEGAPGKGATFFVELPIVAKSSVLPAKIAV